MVSTLQRGSIKSVGASIGRRSVTEGRRIRKRPIDRGSRVGPRVWRSGAVANRVCRVLRRAADRDRAVRRDEASEPRTAHARCAWVAGISLVVTRRQGVAGGSEDRQERNAGAARKCGIREHHDQPPGPVRERCCSRRDRKRHHWFTPRATARCRLGQIRGGRGQKARCQRPRRRVPARESRGRALDRWMQG